MFETIFGGISGLLGSVITSIVSYKTQKLKNEHDIAMADIELKKMDKEKEIMLAEAEANIRITEVETEAKIELADADVFKESIKAAQEKALSDKVHEMLLKGGRFSRIVAAFVAFLFGIVDFIKRMIRPSLTLYLVGLTTWITYIAWKIMETHNQQLTSKQATDIFDQVITIVIYLTVTCVTWWFGDRRMAKFLMRLNDGNIKDQSDLRKKTSSPSIPMM